MPVQRLKSRWPTAKVSGRQRPHARMEATMNVVCASWKTKLIARANTTNSGYPGGCGWCTRGSKFSSENARLTSSMERYSAMAKPRVIRNRPITTIQKTRSTFLDACTSVIRVSEHVNDQERKAPHEN